MPAIRTLVLTAYAVALPAALTAQVTQRAVTEDTTASATNNDTGPAGIIPYVRGFNASVATTSQHDSSNGWSSLLQPDLAYRLNQHFSADVSAPIYTYVNVVITSGTKAVPVYTNATRKGVPGDVPINGHYETSFSLLDYASTLTLGLPTGNSKDGLGAGQATYFFNNHLEKAIGILTPEIELGIGDASDLIGQRIRKDYTSVGELANFQAGTSVDLTHNINFEAAAYENLPIGAETLLSSTGKGRKKVTTTTKQGAAEDNGFLTSLDIPVTGHITLTGFYNRSLRNKIDTAGFSLTFLLKAPPKDIIR